MKTLFIIAGPNGAGKTTASMAILPEVLDCTEYVNADNIAKGLNPLNPESDAVSVAAGKLMLQRIDMLLGGEQNFAIETTLATRTHANLVRKAQEKGWHVVLVFFWLSSPEAAIRRVAQRVNEGGHNIPEEVIRRRYQKGLDNFFHLFLPIVDDWMLYNNSDMEKLLVAFGTHDGYTCILEPRSFDAITAYVPNYSFPITTHHELDAIHTTIHTGLNRMQHQMLHKKAERNEMVVRVDESGRCYEQSARTALMEIYHEMIALPETPHSTADPYANTLSGNTAKDTFPYPIDPTFFGPYGR